MIIEVFGLTCLAWPLAPLLPEFLVFLVEIVIRPSAVHPLS